MKKYLIFIGGFILGIAGSCYAAYKLTAAQVSFDKINTNLNSNDVQTAIDEIADILSYGDAESSDILEGKTALVKGKKVTGLLKNNSNKLSLLSTKTVFGKGSASYTFSSDYDKIIVFGGSSPLTQTKNATTGAGISFSLKSGTSKDLGYASSGGTNCDYWGVCSTSGIKVILLENVKKGDVVTTSSTNQTNAAQFIVFSLQ